MRRLWCVTLALALLPWLPVAAQAPSVAIVELLADPDAGGREFIELWSDAGTDLTGWRIQDEAGNAFDLTGHSIAAGGRLVVWGGGEATAEGPAWSKSTVWNNPGDTAYLYHGETLVDSFSYGSAGGPAVAPTGQSLQWDGSTWFAGDPTPGRAPGGSGGSATVTVVDAPPDVAFVDLPAEASPGAAVAIRFTVHDPNGDDTIVAWSLFADGAVAAQGDAAGDHDVSLTAPQSGTWTLAVTATDGTSEGRAEASIAIVAPELRVTVPAEGIRFPDIAPGAEAVEASAAFTIHNDGGGAATPRIDIADFSGPTAFAADGRLSLLVAGTVVPYAGPLTALPELAPGASHDVTLRIDHVPLPLAAGTYGTSFTVVA